MTEVSAHAQPPAPATKHIVDELIEDRGPRLLHTPLWPAVKAIGYPMLGYNRALAMADAIADLNGEDCMAWISDYLSLSSDVTGVENVPSEGPCVIVANHPGGIADGVALWDALIARRPDLVFYANRDALKVCPGLESRIIPVEWRDQERTRSGSRDLLKRTIQTFREGGCLVIFPSGRMSQWNWAAWRLKEQPWAHTAASLGRKFGAPVVPLAVRQRMPYLYYVLAQVHEELKDMTIFHGLMGKKGARYGLDFLPAMDLSQRTGSDAELTETLRALCEDTAWGKR